MDDLISRQDAIDEAEEWIETYSSGRGGQRERDAIKQVISGIKKLPSAQPEALTDKEQRIFLAAMSREEEVCKEIDTEMTREPYEDSLVRICREITRKVKDAIWT